MRCSIILILLFHYSIAAYFTITDVQISNISPYITGNATIHSNRTKYDMYFTIKRQYRVHDLNLRMKVKRWIGETKSWRNLYTWNRIDMCSMLTNLGFVSNAFKSIFSTMLNITPKIRCPIQPGTYAMLDSYVESNVLLQGKYRIFCEVAQVSGEVAKTFAMRVSIQSIV